MTIWQKFERTTSFAKRYLYSEQEGLLASEEEIIHDCSYLPLKPAPPSRCQTRLTKYAAKQLQWIDGHSASVTAAGPRRNRFSMPNADCKLTVLPWRLLAGQIHWLMGRGQIRPWGGSSNQRYD